ncbi:MAG: hypothetical protein ACR2L6_03065 [Gemmatimonadaceae bacterium]
MTTLTVVPGTVFEGTSRMAYPPCVGVLGNETMYEVSYRVSLQRASEVGPRLIMRAVSTPVAVVFPWPRFRAYDAAQIRMFVGAVVVPVRGAVTQPSHVTCIARARSTALGN